MLKGMARRNIARLPIMPTTENTISATRLIRLIFPYIPRAALLAVIAATAVESPVTVSAYIGMKRL